MDLQTEKTDLDSQNDCPLCGLSQQSCQCSGSASEPIPQTAQDSGQIKDKAQSAQAQTINELAESVAQFVKEQTPKKALDRLHGHKFIGGRYQIIELLGTGGMGSVYKVKHQLLNKIFALKVLNEGVDADEKVIRRFDLEAKTVGTLKHDNLIGINDYGVTDEGILFYVMDYLDGIGLDQEIEKNGPLSEPRAISIFLAVCNGLAHAHSKGVVHRDLKPSNIMLVRDEHGNEIPKIVDFGIAKRQEGDAKLTQTGEVLGTPQFMSPEQCMGQTVDERSDIYSLGCVIYQSVSGLPPFVAQNAIQTIFKHINDPAVPLRKLEKVNVSQSLEQVVANCLEKDPELRIQSANGLAINLERIQAGKKPLDSNVLKKITKSHGNNALRISVSAVVLTALVLCGCKLYFNSIPKYDVLNAYSMRELAAGHNKEALAFGDQALIQLEKAGSTPTQFERYSVYRNLYDVYDNNGQDRKAIAIAAKLARASKEINRREELITYGSIAAEGLLDSDPKLAVDLINMVLQATEATGFNESGAMLYLERIGADMSARKMYKEAIAVLKQAEEIGKRHDPLDAPQLFHIDSWLIYSYDQAKQFDQVEELIKSATPLMKAKGISESSKTTFAHRAATARKHLKEQSGNKKQS